MDSFPLVILTTLSFVQISDLSTQSIPLLSDLLICLLEIQSVSLRMLLKILVFLYAVPVSLIQLFNIFDSLYHYIKQQLNKFRSVCGLHKCCRVGVHLECLIKIQAIPQQRCFTNFLFKNYRQQTFFLPQSSICLE